MKKLLLLLFIIHYSLFLFQCNGQEFKRNNVWCVGYDPVIKLNYTGGVAINVVNNISTIPYCIIKSCVKILLRESIKLSDNVIMCPSTLHFIIYVSHFKSR